MNTSRLKLAGLFKAKCFAPDGNLKWQADAPNAVTHGGLKGILDCMFHATAASPTYYCGLLLTGAVLATSDVMTDAGHPGWTEDKSYAGNRKEWTEGASVATTTGVSMTNAVSMDFVMNAVKTIAGAFLVSNATLGTAEFLFCTAAFSGGDQVVGIGDTLKVTYTVSGAPA